MTTNIRSLKSSELVEMYNNAAKLVGAKPINKFSDKETAVARTKAILTKAGIEFVERESTLPPPADVPTDLALVVEPKRKTIVPPAKKEKAPKEERVRRSDFNFKPMSQQKEPGGGTLRATAFKRLKEGAKFETVVRMIEKFDADRGKGNATTIERRAYELVRLMHYQCGYGIKHDEATGMIKLYV